MSTLEQKFNEARQRILAGEVLSIADQKELIDALREGRFAAAEAGTKARSERKSTKAAKAGISDEDLDSQLDDLGL